MVNLFVESGANLEARNKNMETPLLVAARRGYFAILKVLIDRGAVITALDK